MSTFSLTPDATTPGFGKISGVEGSKQAPSPALTKAFEADESKDIGEARPRPKANVRDAKRRANMVRRLRRLFAACMGIQAALVIGFSTVNSFSQDVAFAASAITGEAIRIQNPVFDGRDAHSSRYKIVSNAVVRRPEDPERLLLEAPIMTVRSGGEQTFELSAREGLYNRERKTLDLFRDVKLTSSSGYEFTTSQARIFLKQGIAEGDQPIQGFGPMGSIDAQSFRLDQNERWVAFDGSGDQQVVGAIYETSEVALRE